MRELTSDEVASINGAAITWDSRTCTGTWILGGIAVGAVLGGLGGAAAGGFIGGMVADNFCPA